jgi:hypothetical protein
MALSLTNFLWEGRNVVLAFMVLFSAKQIIAPALQRHGWWECRFCKEQKSALHSRQENKE